MSDNHMTDTPRHPMFEGAPILIGDTIRFANIPDADPEYIHEGEEGIVTTIRMVRGEPWMHVTKVGESREGNEIIYDHPTTSARGVIAHWAAKETS